MLICICKENIMFYLIPCVVLNNILSPVFDLWVLGKPLEPGQCYKERQRGGGAQTLGNQVQ